MFERFYTIFNLFCINYLSHIPFQLNKGEERGTYIVSPNLANDNYYIVEEELG